MLHIGSQICWKEFILEFVLLHTSRPIPLTGEERKGKVLGFALIHIMRNTMKWRNDAWGFKHLLQEGDNPHIKGRSSKDTTFARCVFWERYTQAKSQPWCFRSSSLWDKDGTWSLFAIPFITLPEDMSICEDACGMNPWDHFFFFLFFCLFFCNLVKNSVHSPLYHDEPGNQIFLLAFLFLLKLFAIFTKKIII